MANILTIPESGIFFDGSAEGYNIAPILTGNASGVAIQYDGYAGIEINSSATGANYLDRFSVEGANGRLFGVTDEVTGTVFSVNDAAGLPIIEVESTSSHDKITIGEYGTDALVISGSSVQITGSTAATQAYVDAQVATSDTLQEVTANGATTTNSISIHNSLTSVNPRLSVGRDGGQSIQLHVSDITNTIQANQDSDSNGDHIFALNRVFGGTGKNDFQVQKGGSAQLTIDSTGDVGIGVAPVNNYRLEVYDGDYTQMMLRAPNYPTLRFKADNQNSGNNGRISIGANNVFQFNPNNTTNGISIANDGNVGIGTVSPSEKLHVNGNVRGASFGTFENTTARIFSPEGATFNGSGNQTGYLIVKLPDNAGAGINNMMTGIIRVFDYANNESFDVHFAGYWYSGYSWTRCSAWIESEAQKDRNFSVRFGRMTGASGSEDRPFITIGESNSTWSYCKFSVVEYNSGHSNPELEKWNSGWATDLSATFPGTLIANVSNNQVNNWKRNGQDVYYAGGTGNVGIGITAPAYKLSINGSAGIESSEQYLYFHSSATVGSNARAKIRAVGAGGGSGYGGDLRISTRQPNNVWNEDAVIVDSSGNVGIGTTAPSVHLEIKTATNNSSAEEGLRLYNAGGGVGAGVRIGLGVGATYDEKGHIRTDIVSGGAGRLLLGSNGSDRLVINENGKVLVNGAHDNGGKADFAVDGGAQISLYDGQVQMGGTDMNWNAKFFYDSAQAHIAAWDSNIKFFIQGSNTGSASARDIIFSPQKSGTGAATERMRIKGSGNVGIGTTGPIDPLNVQSTGSNEYAFRVFRSTSATQGLGGFYEGGANQGQLWLLKGDNSAGVMVNSNGDSYFNGGNVGIGATAPNAKLHIADSGSDVKLLIDRTDARTYSIYTNSTSDLKIKDEDAGVDRITINSSGEVGIGTTSPVGKLNINTGLTGISYDMVNQANGSISFSNNSGGTAAPTITGKSNNNLGLMFVSGTNNTGPVADMYFDVRENDNTDYSTLTSPAYRFNRAGNALMTILRSGKVGIGTTTSLNGLLNVGSPSATNVKVSRIAGDTTTVYHYGSSEDATLEWTCGSYFNSEVVITASQTNGGTYNNLYIRGIWSNNHTSHHWDELEHVGGLTGTTFTITNGQNGSTTNSGRLTLGVDYVSGSFATLNIRITDFFGTHSYTIT